MDADEDCGCWCHGEWDTLLMRYFNLGALCAAFMLTCPITALAGDREPAGAFHERMPTPSISGMAGGAVASIQSVDGMLRAATRQAQGDVSRTAQTRAAPVRASVEPAAPRSNFGARRSARVPEGGIEIALRDIIARRMGEQSCSSIATYRVVEGGSGFHAHCDGGQVFVIQNAGRQARVSPCARVDAEGVCQEM